MAKKGNELIPSGSSDLFNGERQGFFQQGRDKLDRPYEKKWDNNGVYTKQEELKSGEMKYTIKVPKK